MNVICADGKLIGIAVAVWRERNGRALFTEVQPVAPILAQLHVRNSAIATNPKR
ncbi:MAG: hypothetical protein ACXVAM_01925 [Vulcanimicrobiaceae bacterium]